MDAMELSVLQKNTDAFIAIRPTAIALVPQSKEKVPGGGHNWVDGAPRTPQVFRIIELGMSATPQVIRTTDGTERIAEFWLLGSAGAVVKTNDHWIAGDGREWIVGDVIRSNEYEVRALVAERGR